ncbi:hypothetical protein SERLADRAFT_436986 [Serpula lacrymans var. lacrymans S7.9]|uniref:Ribonuclease H2 subunit B n=1 Tax=Serpula lacrymans var. lacrymans (strain S7.9) TaxID=578457 RepID=F8NUK8_SERL9|nr:uncharacterized protein SERLADRAFT_436986 [Serpula lacrymans var. lacrymans S7.9]EGO25228.1 hypothetical protein SERLADRAFT_436986 [Serpula lacrymans var. lacrymans S7.9]
MTAHVGILPLSVIDALTLHLNDKVNESAAPLWRLPHPRTGLACLFLPQEKLVDPSHPRQKMSILEIQSVTPPNTRSWFIGEEVVSVSSKRGVDGKLLLMTPVDPAFLIIQILLASQPNDGSPGNFRPIDDIFEEAAVKLAKTPIESTPAVQDASAIPSQRDIMQLASLDCIKAAMSQITTEITVYRFSPDNLLAYLRSKVERLSKPEILEKSRSLIRSMAKDGLMEDGREDLLELGRVKAACDLISQYIPPSIYQTLLSSYDFTALNAYLKTFSNEQAALLATNANTSKSKKKNAATNEEDTGKKRKNQVKSSNGVEKLKKANVNGMSKLSSFFKKADA